MIKYLPSTQNSLNLYVLTFGHTQKQRRELFMNQGWRDISKRVKQTELDLRVGCFTTVKLELGLDWSEATKVGTRVGLV